MSRRHEDAGCLCFQCVYHGRYGREARWLDRELRSILAGRSARSSGPAQRALRLFR